ncbi:MAG: putative glycoside hydrolase [Spirochaetia bacterium]|jgi:hypothetical protein|nr:putative glycoside hydrolase [Spirochaetia bacterium]
MPDYCANGRKIIGFLIFIALSFTEAAFAEPEKMITDGIRCYSINRNSGFEVSSDRGLTWKSLNNGLPDKIVYPFNSSEKRNLTSFSIDHDNPSILCAATIDTLYISNESGNQWKAVQPVYPVKKSYYFTAASVKGKEGKNILLGTSFSGIFESNDGGRRWTSYEEKLENFKRGAGFYDDISALEYGPDEGSFFMATGYTGKLFFHRKADSSWNTISVPSEIKKDGISLMHYDSDSSMLHVYSGRSKYSYDTSRKRWLNSSEKLPLKVIPEDKGKIARKEKAALKQGIYLSSLNASSRRIDDYFTFLLDNRMNSVVVDFKDDNGFITFNTNNKTAIDAGAVRRHINAPDFISKAHSRGIYVIARIVVFKDRQLFSHDSYKYALWDSTSDSPWGRMVKNGEESFEQKEFWVDPYSMFVSDYNIAIAQELQSLGVDEIQFDYIRFPTDGNLNQIKYRYKKEGMNKSEALESFLKKAREKITIPVSTDLYGFNAWYKMGNWNGQQIDMFADYVDVICPMFYPSHFPAAFLENLSFSEKAEKIYNEGTARASFNAGSRSIIRPYVQAFLIGSERSFEQPQYSNYLNMQIKGLSDAGSSGFTLWNASGSYYMVNESMKDFAQSTPGS